MHCSRPRRQAPARTAPARPRRQAAVRRIPIGGHWLAGRTVVQRRRSRRSPA